MKSKRDIEDLQFDSVKKDLLKRYQINNTIINNASIATNNIKQKFSEKFLSSAYAFLMAVLILLFIYYECIAHTDNAKKFYLIVLSIGLVFLTLLLIYSCVVWALFRTQYNRQRQYRAINDAISTLLNDLRTFIDYNHNIGDVHISQKTISDYINVIVCAYKTKDKNTNLFKLLVKDWRSIHIIIAFTTFFCIIIFILWVILCVNVL